MLAEKGFGIFIKQFFYQSRGIPDFGHALCKGYQIPRCKKICRGALYPVKIGTERNRVLTP